MGSQFAVGRGATVMCRSNQVRTSGPSTNTQGHEGAVDVEEVGREHAGGLGAQELPPAGVGGPDRGRRDPVVLEDAPDGRGADAVAEFEQLTLDPDVSPQR
jgi:hypothetical protein